MTIDETYMYRCLQLAEHGRGHVAPNPMVGAVLVHGTNIIGEGYHAEYGKPHAEVNCVNSVAAENRHLISSSTLYVSLEPCAHFGKTPPCTDLIIKHRISKVVIGCRDSYEEVNGKGMAILKEAGVQVIAHVLEKDCLEMNVRFFTFHQKKRPYIILKWAQSMDGSIASASKEAVAISGEISNRLVHRWRTEEASILVGTETALIDDPQLTARLWKGKNPIRLVADTSLKLPGHLKLFDQNNRTIIFNTIKDEEGEKIRHYKINSMQVNEIMDACYRLNIQSVLIEGGAALLQSFIDAELYDEIRVITNTAMTLPGGFLSPKLKKASLKKQEWLATDLIHYYS